MKSFPQNLYHKNGLIIMALARKLLGKQPGDRMENIIDIAAGMSVGRGTVQTAIRTLEEGGAIALDVRGHLGTFITAIDYTVLMSVSGMTHLVGVMPLPYSKRYEGLATGIYNVLNEKSGVPVNLAYMPGSERRINSLLEERYDFAVLSRAAADHHVSENDQIEILFSLNEHTYVSDHGFICRENYEPGDTVMRIGVDHSSFDILSMTSFFFQNRKIKIVPMKYSSVINNIKAKKIDGAIWSLEEQIIRDPELRYEPIQSNMDSKYTQAALLIRKSDDGTKNFLERFFDIDEVERIQGCVLNNEVLPNY